METTKFSSTAFYLIAIPLKTAYKFFASPIYIREDSLQHLILETPLSRKVSIKN